MERYDYYVYKTNTETRLKKEALISKDLLWEDKVRYKSQKVANVHSLHSWWKLELLWNGDRP